LSSPSAIQNEIETSQAIQGTMDTFDIFISLWSLMLLMIVFFNALAIRQLTKMREEE
jgi:hypothetical protein